ncbi:sensor histidine kinase [Flavobacterium sp.]|uniref:sensor histidine kinase n=1 Tax=Flavobacterium sp. TaxID=239 RepID=UPI002605B685|nr:sensor histidine kinase [Flavobacterium sp.]
MKKLLVLFSFLYCHLIVAQDPYYINYNTNDGLPSSTIYSIHPDEKGFLWFTTDAGIAKYDSHTFTSYTTDNGLPDNEIFQMKKDHKGRTWLLTLNGKTCFLYRNKLYNEFNSALVKKISGSSLIIDFYEDNQNNCYFVYKDGTIMIVNEKDEVIQKSNPGFSLFGVWGNKNKLFYLCTLGVFDQKNKSLNPDFHCSNYYRMFHIGKEQYFSEQNHLYHVNDNNHISTVLTLAEDIEILQLFVENPYKIWICTRKGLFLYENQTLKNHFFKNEVVSNIAKDFEGSYWISTLKNGAYYVPSFEVFVDNMNEANPLKLNCISINAQKEIWLGGDNNNYYYKSPGKSLVKNTLLTDHQTDQIRNIRFFGSNKYIAGKKMVLKIDAKKNTINYGFGSNDILIDGDDFFIGYNVTFKISNKLLNKQYPPILKDKLLLSKRTNVFAQDTNHNVWIGTNNGLYCYNKKDSVVDWSSKLGNIKTTISDLYFDSESKTLWVATASKGVFCIKNKESVQHISKKNGLNSITCNSLIKIAPDYYLVGTNNGLNAVIFQDNAYKIKNLNTILGLKNKRINDIAFLDNIVYLATDAGLISFNIKNINTKKIRPKCWISYLRNGSKTMANKPQHQFNYDNNDVSINFVGISYINQNNLTYYYKLDGQNDSWSPTTESQINYRSLAAGKYTFSVYCNNGYGIKSPIESVSFEILAPFWQQPWFVFLGIVILGLLIYFFIKYRLQQQQKRFEMEKVTIQIERDKAHLERQTIDLEQKALRQQMNPHFIFNALNTIKGYYSEGDMINASTYISKFSKLLRMLLENADQTIALASEIEMLRLYIELTKIRYKNKFEFELFVDERLNINDVAIPTLLLQPIVENAIIHGLAPKNKKGLLKISFLINQNQLECHVEDNGIGREASGKKQKHKEYQSKALEIATERIALFSKDIGPSTFEIIDLISGGKASGTKVIVTIPLINIW